MNKTSTYRLIVGTSVFAILLIVGAVMVHRSSISTVQAQTSRDIALTCTTDMATQFHIHPVLIIIINGVKQTIPANIGVTSTCLKSIHTHDDSGKIHVEAPAQKDFTLSDFFAVWGKTFNKGQILTSLVNKDFTITVTINGTAVDTYENTPLTDEEQIVISYTRK